MGQKHKKTNIKAIIYFHLRKAYKGSPTIVDESATVTSIDGKTITFISNLYNISENVLDSITVSFYEMHAKGSYIYINSSRIKSIRRKEKCVEYTVVTPKPKVLGTSFVVPCVGVRKYMNIHKPKNVKKIKG